jgi:hypothetical protein
MRSDTRCIFCGLPADRRCGTVIVLANGRRLHGRCEWPLIRELLQYRKPSPTKTKRLPLSNFTGYSHD